MNLYPLPNVSIPGAAYNYSAIQPVSKQIATEPAIKLDYQVSNALRVSGKYSGWLQKVQPVPGTIPGFNDTIYPHPVAYSWASNANYTLNKTTFIEADVRSQLVGAGGLLTGDQRLGAGVLPDGTADQ